jgi:hypothetical protein
MAFDSGLERFRRWDWKLISFRCRLALLSLAVLFLFASTDNGLTSDSGDTPLLSKQRYRHGKELGVGHSHASRLFHLFRRVRRLSRGDESDEEIKDESRSGWEG